MNGFDSEIHKRFFGMAPEITVSGRDGKLADWQMLAEDLKSMPGVKAVAPYVGGQGLLTHDGRCLLY